MMLIKTPLLRVQSIIILLLISALTILVVQGCTGNDGGNSSESQLSNTESVQGEMFTRINDSGSDSGSSVANVDLAGGAFPSFVDIINKTRNGTVNIIVEQTVTQQNPLSQFNGNPSEFFEDFFGEFFQQQPAPSQPRTRKAESQGSGFILNADGYIVTNNHVVDNQTSIVVTLASGNPYNATLIGTDPLTDLALIKIDANETLTPLPLGNSDATNIGEWVLAIGSPYGLDATVTAGIISAKDRSIHSGPFDSFLQTDASINPGNSGGPLINMAGEVIGINTAIYRSAHGLGFSIPINTLTNLLPQLLNNSVVHGWIGVTLQELTPALAQSFDVPDGYNNAIVIADTVKGDPADKSGLLPGDVILDANGKPVEGFRGFAQTVGGTTPGDSVVLGILRKGKRMTIKVVVSERPETANKPNSMDDNDNDTVSSGAISVQNLDNDTLEEYNTTYGVGISSVDDGSNAMDIGLRSGLVILEINNTKITSTEVFQKVFDQIKSGDTVKMRVATPQGKTYVAYKKD